ncbi:MAG: LysM peptidoglycan-binding domain-containing protein, partial [Syntrophobacterales bacterium]
YKSSVNAILAANHLTIRHSIREGRWIKIPSRGYVYSETRPSTPKGGDVGTYSVKEGDSLWLIAKRFGTTISEIKALNGLPRNDLSIGQIIKVRGNVTIEKVTKSSTTYVVKKGDALSTIASQNGIDLNRLLSLNNLRKNALIQPGQVIIIK